MLTIQTKNGIELIKKTMQLATAAREFRFWDHYHKINQGEHAYNKRMHYMKQIEEKLTAMQVKRNDRLEIIKHILLAEEL